MLIITLSPKNVLLARNHISRDFNQLDVNQQPASGRRW